MPPARLQRWLNAMVVTAVLDRVRDEDDEPIFLLNGGVAMELRLQLRARAIRLRRRISRTRAEEVIDHLDEALAQPWNNFNLTRDEPEIITNTKAVRVRLRPPMTDTQREVWRRLAVCSPHAMLSRPSMRFGVRAFLLSPVGTISPSQCALRSASRFCAARHQVCT